MGAAKVGRVHGGEPQRARPGVDGPQVQAAGLCVPVDAGSDHEHPSHSAHGVFRARHQSIAVTSLTHRRLTARAH